MDKSKNKSIINFLIRIWLPIILFAIVSFVIDRVVKELILSYFTVTKSSLHITSFFSLELIFNYGISFSFLYGLNSMFIVAISTCALIILLILFYKISNFNKVYIRFAVGSIIGATIGNIYDRVVFGGVIDFLYFHYENYSFPIFNSADVLITLSAILLFINLMFDKQNKKSKKI